MPAATRAALPTPDRERTRNGRDGTRAALATADRERTLDALEAERFDLLVIGGGITGAGIAREAARRGLATALVEARDFASGTSGRSSKLIHGGLRYLAQGEVGLVRETALERKAVRRLAPHLAEPRWMLVPARSRAGLLKFRAGIGTYEKLGAVEEADRHRNWGEEELAREEPLLRRDRTPWACAYREYVTEDARLVLANLRDARRRGAVLLNHAPAVEILTESGRAAGARVRCAHTGREVRVRARAVVNAGGPWVEAVRRLEDDAAPTLLHLSKGVHVVLPRARLPVRHVVVMQTADRRSIFVVPRGDVVYVGTTDTSWSGSLDDEAAITREDVAYLLEPLPRTFDVTPVAPEECTGAWSGLRPLIAQPGKPPTEISRRDEIWIGPAGVVSIAGGKLTGYRKMASAALERVAERLDTKLPEPASDVEPLPGGDFDGDLDRLAAKLADAVRLEPEPAARLARLYGTEAQAVTHAGAAPLVPGGRVLAGEVDWAVREEGAATLSDVLDRRTRASLYLPHECDALREPMAERLGALLGWSAARRRDEVTRSVEAERRRMAFREETTSG